MHTGVLGGEKRMIRVYSANAKWNSSAERLWNGTERNRITFPGVNGVLEGRAIQTYPTMADWQNGRGTQSFGQEIN